MHNTRTRTRNLSFLVKPDPKSKSPTRQGLVLAKPDHPGHEADTFRIRIEYLVLSIFVLHSVFVFVPVFFCVCVFCTKSSKLWFFFIDDCICNQSLCLWCFVQVFSYVRFLNKRGFASKVTIHIHPCLKDKEAISVGLKTVI